MKEVKITIHQEGDVEVKVVCGGAGKSCLDLTKAIETSLGVVQKRTETPEMREVTRVKAHN